MKSSVITNNPDGSVTYSDIVNNHRVKQTYMGYTARECQRKFNRFKKMAKYNPDWFTTTAKRVFRPQFV